MFIWILKHIQSCDWSDDNTCSHVTIQDIVKTLLYITLV